MTKTIFHIGVDTLLAILPHGQCSILTNQFLNSAPAFQPHS